MPSSRPTRSARRARPRQLALAAVGVLVLSLAVPTVSSATAATGITYHVEQTGSDAAAGSASAPFRTIQRCADVAAAGDTCLIGSGVYRETVTPAHDGTATAPVTFAAAPGADVTVDGTDPVTGWTLDTGSVYKTAVRLSGTAAHPYSSTPHPADDDLWANQLFAGTSMVPEAAYPAPTSDPFTQTYITGGWSSTRSGGGDCTLETLPCRTTITGTLTYPGFPAFGDLTGAVVQFAGGWVALSADVTHGTLSGSQKTLDISFPQSDDAVYPGGGNVSQFRLVGSRSFLTGPGQWYYDPAAAELYMWSTDGGAPADIRAKRRNYSFDLDGAAYVTVQGVSTFANSITTDDTSSHITIDGVKASFLSHWQTAQYVDALPYAGIYDANHRYDSGILLHGTGNTLRNSVIEYSAGNGVNLEGSGHTVEDNLIRAVGSSGTYTAAVTLEVGTHDSTIARNTIRDTGRDAINMNTNAFPNDGYRNNDISYNDISGYAKIAYDLGGIYACCDTSLAGTRIHHNTIHDPANTGNGMHFDNGAYGMTVDHNVIWGLKGVGQISQGGNGINLGGNQNRNPGSGLPYFQGTFVNNTIRSGVNYTLFNYYADASYVSNTVVENNVLDGAHPGNQDYGYIAGGTPRTATNLVTLRDDDGSGVDPRYLDAATNRFWPRSGAPVVDAGTVVPGLTDGFTGTAPDIGAYESGTTPWTAGCDLAACVQRTPLDRTGWTATADSAEVSAEDGRAANVLDGDEWTIWHTRYTGGTAPLPHSITLDLGAAETFDTLGYTPRRGGGGNGNISTYQVFVSQDGAAWGTAVAAGSFDGSTSNQYVRFPTTTARYVRLVATGSANGRDFSAAAELNLYVTGAPGAPTIPVEATAQVRCIGSKATLVVKATDDAQVPVSITLRSAYGDRAFAGVAPGGSVVHAFTVRTAQVPSGTVSVEAAGAIGGRSVTTTTAVAYDARTCG